MYSEAKLAFYIYLWYPKTKVRNQNLEFRLFSFLRSLLGHLLSEITYLLPNNFSFVREQLMYMIPSLDHM